MTLFRAALKFSSAHHGWVEQLYLQSPSFRTALTSALDLARARYSILGQGVRLYQVRVTQPGYPHASATAEVDGTTLPVPAMLDVEGAEVRLEGGRRPTHRRSYFLRGLPLGAIVNPSGPSTWAPTWSAAILAWLARLSGGQWLMQCRGYDGPRMSIVGLYPLVVPGSDYDLPDGGPPQSSLWTQAVLAQIDVSRGAPGFDQANPAAPVVRISSVRWEPLGLGQKPPINGEHFLTSVFGDTLQYVGVVPSEGSYGGRGVAQIHQSVYLPIRSAVLTRAGTRHCGPPTAPVVPVPVVGPASILVPARPGPGPAVVESIPRALPQLGEEIQPKVSIDPVVGPIVPPPYPEPVSATLADAQDVLIYIAENLTFSQSTGEYRPIGIARVLNLENTWWVGLAGLYPEGNENTGILAAISAGLDDVPIYTQAVKLRALENIPIDASIVWQGFSLGGMQAEIVSGLFAFRNRRKAVVTYGSPIVKVSLGPRSIVRFKCFYDLVPQTTPFGFASTMLADTGYIVIKNGERSGDFPDCHNRMYLYRDLRNYDAWGKTPSDRPPIILGTLQRFPPNL